MRKKRKTPTGDGFAELIGIMRRLRGSDGCPWDKEQTHRSLKPYLLEETYEFLEAIDGGDAEEMAEELGDLLLQILFHCQIASEEGRFDADRVLSSLKNKLIRRHPHVFSNRSLPDAKSVSRHWIKVKAREQPTKAPSALLGNLPKGMPALTRAQRLGERASQLGFDWPEMRPVWDKVQEELGELQEAVASAEKPRVAAEIGDLFFALVNLCRFLEIEAEDALRESLGRFMDRFEYTERQIRRRGKTLLESSFEEVDAAWEDAKKRTARDSRGRPGKTSARKRRRLKKRSTRP